MWTRPTTTEHLLLTAASTVTAPRSKVRLTPLMVLGTPPRERTTARDRRRLLRHHRVRQRAHAALRGLQSTQVTVLPDSEPYACTSPRGPRDRIVVSAAMLFLRPLRTSSPTRRSAGRARRRPGPSASAVARRSPPGRLARWRPSRSPGQC
ncbi:hypothetical protein [Streptomyces sp. NPDC054783]